MFYFGLYPVVQEQRIEVAGLVLFHLNVVVLDDHVEGIAEGGEDTVVDTDVALVDVADTECQEVDRAGLVDGHNKQGSEADDIPVEDEDDTAGEGEAGHDLGLDVVLVDLDHLFHSQSIAMAGYDSQ